MGLEKFKDLGIDSTIPHTQRIRFVPLVEIYLMTKKKRRPSACSDKSSQTVTCLREARNDAFTLFANQRQCQIRLCALSLSKSFMHMESAAWLSFLDRRSSETGRLQEAGWTSIASIPGPDIECQVSGLAFCLIWPAE